MTFFRRLLYYLFGVGLGIIVVYFFFKDRDFDAWLPEGRVLEQVQRNPVTMESRALCQMKCLQMNDNWLIEFLENADVEFSESDTHRKPCPIYLIRGTVTGKSLIVHLEMCRDASVVWSVQEQNNISCSYEN